MELAVAKALVIKAGKELVERGLIARTWGNVSCKVDDYSFAITPSGRDYLSLTPDEIVLVAMADLSYDGDVKPSSEKGAHAQVYKIKPEAGFVIHTHQENASVLSACNINRVQASERYTSLNKEIVCTGYGLPSTKKLSNEIAKTLEKSKGQGIVLKNHGALCYGSDYEDAFKAALELEDASLAYIQRKFAKVSDNKKLDSPMASIYDYVLSERFVDLYEDIEIPAIEGIGDYSYYEIEDDLVTRYAASLGMPIRPMVDDFAQIIGLKVVTVENDKKAINKALKKSAVVLVEGVGAICCGENSDDVEAIRMIIIKTCKAHMCAMIFGKVKPINGLESKLMNVIYKLKYSKQKGEV